MDIAPILSEVENVPVITLEKPQYPLESAYNICDPSMTKVRQEADGGTVFNYDNPETGEQRDLYFVSAPGDSYDNVLSVIMEYRSQKIEESGILESSSGKSYRINEVDWEKVDYGIQMTDETFDYMKLPGFQAILIDAQTGEVRNLRKPTESECYMPKIKQ